MLKMIPFGAALTYMAHMGVPNPPLPPLSPVHDVGTSCVKFETSQFFCPALLTLGSFPRFAQAARGARAH